MDAQVMTVTPKVAQKLLDLRWEKQRKIRPAHVAFLIKEMQRGRFDPATIQLLHIPSQDKKVMIDGQHALTAIVESGKSQQMVVMEDVIKSEDEIPFRFARIDVQRKRNLGDSIYAFDLPDMVPFSRSYIKKIASAIRFIETDFGLLKYEESAIEDSIKSIVDWTDYAACYFDIYESEYGVKGVKQRFLNRSVLAVGLVTFRYVDNQEKVKSFWNGFIHGTNLKTNDPRLIGRNKYLSVSTMGGSPHVGMETWSANLISRLVAWAWNTYYLGEKRSRITLRNKDKNVSIEIQGTKYFKG